MENTNAGEKLSKNKWGMIYSVTDISYMYVHRDHSQQQLKGLLGHRATGETKLLGYISKKSALVLQTHLD